MRIVSWNVNGLRACAKKGFLDVLDRSEADVVSVQEVRAFEDQLPDKVRSPEGWCTHFVPAERAGYSGVGLFSRTASLRLPYSALNTPTLAAMSHPPAGIHAASSSAPWRSADPPLTVMGLIDSRMTTCRSS